ncbi:MAG: hypothetical protein J7L78_02735, partial [Dehalococcoidales bacterium]|nr:hypothetical protein [Dehalococcoidales bacterium]
MFSKKEFFAVFTVMMLVGTTFSTVVYASPVNKIREVKTVLEDFKTVFDKLKEILPSTDDNKVNDNNSTDFLDGLIDLSDNNSGTPLSLDAKSNLKTSVDEKEINEFLEELYKNESLRNKLREQVKKLNETLSNLNIPKSGDDYATPPTNKKNDENVEYKTTRSRDGYWLVPEHASQAIQLLLSSLVSQNCTTRDVTGHTGEKFRILFETIASYVGFDQDLPDADVSTDYSNSQIKAVWLEWLNNLNDTVLSSYQAGEITERTKNYLTFIIEIVSSTIEIIGDNYDRQNRLVPGEINISYFVTYSDNPFNSFSYLNMTLPHEPDVHHNVVKIKGYGASLVTLVLTALDLMKIEAGNVRHPIVYRVGGEYLYNGVVKTIWDSVGGDQVINLASMGLSAVFNVTAYILTSFVESLVNLGDEMAGLLATGLLESISAGISVILFVYTLYKLAFNWEEMSLPQKIISGIGVIVGIVSIINTIAYLALGAVFISTGFLALVGAVIILVGFLADMFWAASKEAEQKKENEGKYKRARDAIRRDISDLSTKLFNAYTWLRQISVEYSDKYYFFDNLARVAANFTNGGYGQIKHVAKAWHGNFITLQNLITYHLFDINNSPDIYGIPDGEEKIAGAIKEITNPSWENGGWLDGCYLYGYKSKQIKAIHKSAGGLYQNRTFDATIIENDSEWHFNTSAVDYDPDYPGGPVVLGITGIPVTPLTEPDETPDIIDTPHDFRFNYPPFNTLIRDVNTDETKIEGVYNGTVFGDEVNSGDFIHFNSPGHVDIDVNENYDDSNEPSWINDYETANNNRWIEASEGSYYWYKFMAEYNSNDGGDWPYIDNAETLLTNWFNDISDKVEQVSYAFKEINNTVQAIGSNFIEEFLKVLEIPKIVDTLEPKYINSGINKGKIELQGKVVKRYNDVEDDFNRTVVFYWDKDYHSRASDYAHHTMLISHDGDLYFTLPLGLDLDKPLHYRVAVVNASSQSQLSDARRIISQGADIIISQDPKACFEWKPESPKEGDRITLDASCSEGNKLTYKWIINGETIGTGKIVKLLCLPAGNNKIELKVVDNRGRSDVCEENIVVAEGMNISEGVDNYDYEFVDLYEKNWLPRPRGKWIGIEQEQSYDEDCVITTPMSRRILRNGEGGLTNLSSSSATFYTFVDGPLNVSFNWTIFAGPLDCLEFWSGDTCLKRIKGYWHFAWNALRGKNFWRKENFTIGENGTVKLRWTYRQTPLVYPGEVYNVINSGLGLPGQPFAMVDHIVITPSNGVSLVEGLETNISEENWSWGCNAPLMDINTTNVVKPHNWTGTYNTFCDEFIGHDFTSAVSGSIPNNGKTWVQATVEGPGKISF